VPPENLAPAADYASLGALLAGLPAQGTRWVPERHRGCVTVQLDSTYPELAPEFRGGDVLIVRLTAKPRRGAVVVAQARDPQTIPPRIAGEFRGDEIVPISPVYPRINAASFDIIGTVEGLADRDYSEGIPR
jgi:hypothetical protein